METAMRAGEIRSLTRARVDVKARVAYLPDTKNGDDREVPLTKDAIALLDCMPKGELWEDLNAGSHDALFRKAKKRAGIGTVRGEHLTFHDLRAEALTRLSKKVPLITLAAIAGHRDLNSLQGYYRESASDIAARLDA
jgi:integrase